MSLWSRLVEFFRSRNPDTDFALAQQAWTKITLHEFEAAEALLKQIIARKTSNYEAWAIQSLTYVWITAERFAEIISLANQYPAESRALLRARAQAYWYLGEYKRATDDYSRLIDLDPEDACARSSRGQILAESGDFQSAVRDLDIAIRGSEQNDELRAFALNGKAVALVGLGSVDAAFAAFEESLALRPQNAWVFFNRARLYESMGRSSEALRDYHTALVQQGPKLSPHLRALAKQRLEALGE